MTLVSAHHARKEPEPAPAPRPNNNRTKPISARRHSICRLRIGSRTPHTACFVYHGRSQTVATYFDTPTAARNQKITLHRLRVASWEGHKTKKKELYYSHKGSTAELARQVCRGIE